MSANVEPNVTEVTDVYLEAQELTVELSDRYDINKQDQLKLLRVLFKLNNQSGKQ